MKHIKYLIIFIFFVMNLFKFNSVLAYSEDKEITSNYSIVADLNINKLFLVNNNTNKIFKDYPIASGKLSTPSPVGTWKIVNKESGWGKGFGSRWMALNVPWGKYGIHGTNKPFSIGGSASLGCIRMFNKDVEDLYSLVNVGTTVVIYGGSYNMEYNTFRLLSPGDRGSDVFEVQRRLKNLGYYKGPLNGIYGDELKKDVIRFEKDNQLLVTHNLDKKFYRKLGIIPFD